MTWRDFLDCAVETARITAALFAILIGALLFSQLMNFGGFPRALQAFVTGFGVEPYVVIVTICVLYIVLGTFFEELSMILLTVPIFFPLVVGLGFDPIWFGIVIVMVVEMGLISPPVGMNLFVVQSLAEDPGRHALPLDHAVHHRRHRPPRASSSPSRSSSCSCRGWRASPSATAGRASNPVPIRRRAASRASDAPAA